MLYLEKHYGIGELFQGANKILNYSSPVQLTLDPLKGKKGITIQQELASPPSLQISNDTDHLLYPRIW